MKKVVLLRHGESTWNKENRFTGWTDVELSEKGMQEAKNAGKLLKDNNFTFDIAFTSYLKRAIKTLWITLEELDLMWIDVEKSWKLNERHYGTLQGLNKSETTDKYGSEQVHLWRRSYSVPPPPLDINDDRYAGKCLQYKNLQKSEIPLTESLKETVARAVPYWEENIAPLVKANKNVLITAHGNSIRALIKYFDNVSENEIAELNVPTGIPLVYEFDDNLKAIKHYYLGDQDEINDKINAVANQSKASK